MRPAQALIAATFGAAILATPAFADATDRTGRCFSMRDFENWKSPDAKTIYIRAGLHRYYRLDLASNCSALQQIDAHLITRTRGSDQVCDGLDWDLAVSDSTGFRDGGGFRQACIVKTQTPLTDADVAQIPKKFLP